MEQKTYLSIDIAPAHACLVISTTRGILSTTTAVLRLRPAEVSLGKMYAPVCGTLFSCSCNKPAASNCRYRSTLDPRLARCCWHWHHAGAGYPLRTALIGVSTDLSLASLRRLVDLFYVDVVLELIRKMSSILRLSSKNHPERCGFCDRWRNRWGQLPPGARAALENMRTFIRACPVLSARRLSMQVIATWRKKRRQSWKLAQISTWWQYSPALRG